MARIASVNVRWEVIAIIALGILAGWLAVEKVRCSMNDLRVRFAREQIELFNAVAAEATAIEDDAEIARKRQYIEQYYPSGTKQAVGTDLDMIVENARRAACGTIDAHRRDLNRRR
jgi:hypothetical protein